MLCVCSEIPVLNISTRLVIVMHHSEWSATTNTGRFALRALPNSEVRFRGLPETPIQLDDLKEPERDLLFLYPAENAQVLTAEYVATLKRPATLVVPDGTWRQAAKVFRREPFLREHAKPVVLPVGINSGYLLRRAPNDISFCTIEAIAYALGALENDAIKDQLLAIFNLVNHRVLATRSPDWIESTMKWATKAGRLQSKQWQSIGELREKFLPKGYRP